MKLNLTRFLKDHRKKTGQRITKVEIAQLMYPHLSKNKAQMYLYYFEKSDYFKKINMLINAINTKIPDFNNEELFKNE